MLNWQLSNKKAGLGGVLLLLRANTLILDVHSPRDTQTQIPTAVVLSYALTQHIVRIGGL